jgi:hypothetical protein
MRKFAFTLLVALISTLLSGCTEQELMAAKGRPEPVIIIVE